MFKPLRLILAVAAVSLIVFATAPGTEIILHGAGIIPTLLLPVISPLVFFVLLLDSLMIKVFLTEKTGSERTQYRFALYLNLLLVVVLFLRWYPYFKAL